MVTPNSLHLDGFDLPGVVILADAPGGGGTGRWGSHWISRVTPPAEIKPGLAALYLALIDAIAKE